MTDDVSYSIVDIRRFDDAQIEGFYEYLSPDRKAKADACKLTNDRKLSILSSFQLERLLEGMDVQKPYNYTYLPSGKPVLDGENVYFSISHSGNFAAAVVSKKYSVGIDVEDIVSKKRDPERLKKVSEKYFLPEELEMIDDSEMFFRIWTMKEAYMKAIGKPLLTVFREKAYDPEDIALTQKHSSDAVFSIYRVVPE